MNFWMWEHREELEDAMVNSKMFFVVPAGDEGINLDETPVYPACLESLNLITVANLSYDGNLHTASNFGAVSVDVAAPGTCIHSTNGGNRLDYGTDSSLSAAIVTGIVAFCGTLKEEPYCSSYKNALCRGVKVLDSLVGKVATSGVVNGRETFMIYL